MHHELMQTPELPEAIRARVRPLPPGFEEPSDRQVIPYEPTPPDPSRVRLHQGIVHSKLATLVDEHAPAEFPPEIKDAIYLDYLSGHGRREAENIAPFRDWMKCEARTMLEVDLEIENKIAEATATPHEILDFMQTTTLRRSGLAKLTHPYGYRMEHVPAMRQSVFDAIEHCGGLVASNEELKKTSSLHIHPRGQQARNGNGEIHTYVNTFLITYKRCLGQLARGDGTTIEVMERQAAAIYRGMDMPESMRRKLGELQSLYQSNNVDWRARVIGNEESPGFLRTFLQQEAEQDTTAEYFMPLSTTVYAAVKDNQ